MPRVIIHRSLPPLKKVLRHFLRFPEDKSHQLAMTDELRSAAENLRTAKPQPFYAMREVADFFQVSLSNVARVYTILEREGLITRIRGSQTILIGKKALTRDSIRGIVGIPIWMKSMAFLSYTRTFAMLLGEQLRNAGFVADIILYAAKEEEVEPEFADRLLKHRLDAVILHTPFPGCLPNILTLRERGVRVFVIHQKENLRPGLPAVIYLENVRPTFKRMVNRWQQVGIRKVLLWSPYEYERTKVLDAFESVVVHEGLAREHVRCQPRNLLPKLRQRTSPTAVVFLGDFDREEVCKYEPKTIEQIAKLSRLTFLAGIDPGSYLQSRIRVDLVDFSPTEMAERLAADVCRMSVLPDGICHTLQPHYYEQVRLTGSLLADHGQPLTG